MTGERILYHANGSIPNWRVLLAMHEKRLEFTPRRLRLMGAERETRRPEFLAVNPRGQTPVLVDHDGTTINESFAILEYLERRYPDPPLLPPVSDPAGLARALARAHEAETFACAYDPLEQLFLVKPAELDPHRRAAIADALAAVAFELDLWETRAAAAEFIAGDAFTQADCAFYPTLAYMLRRGLSLARHPALEAYMQRVRARPAAEAAHPEGWQHGRVGKPDLFALARAAMGG